MALNSTQNDLLIGLAKKLIKGMQEVEGLAMATLNANPRRSSAEVALAYTTNAMASKYGPTEVHAVEAIRDGQTSELRQLRDEPFIARIVADDENGEQHTFYFARSMPLRSAEVRDLDGRLASYRAPLGRLAEHKPGDEVTVRLKKGSVTYTLRERVRLRPARVGSSWDGQQDRVEAEGLVVTLSSLLDFLGQYGPPPPIEDLLAGIEAVARQNAAVQDGLRRQVINRISLRDEAVLDQFQGEVFRLPLNRRLMLYGPPGTGKTTTLIKRIAQKSRVEEISEEERELVPADRAEELFHPANWVMYTPTELLKLYLKEAFARESVAASSQRVRTWVDERRRLGREVLRILRSENGGRFTFDDEANTLLDSTSPAQVKLFEAFVETFEAQIVTRYATTLRALASTEDSGLAAVVSRMRRRVDDDKSSFRSLFDLVEFHSELSSHEQPLAASSESALRLAINAILNKDRALIDGLAGILATVVAVTEDEEEDEDAEAEEDRPAVPGRDSRPLAARALRSALSARAKELHDGKIRTRSGRNRQVLDWLGTRLPDEATLRALGTTLVNLERVRFLSRTYRNLLDQVPVEYQRFRRAAMKSGVWYRQESRSSVERGRVMGIELDVMLLVMLRHARRFLMRDGGRALRPGVDTRIAILDSVKGEYVTQILVDEATDFSAVQLACMQELARPEFRSFFVCGDVHQRVTPWGISSLDELRWVADDFDLREISIGYRQSRCLAALAGALSRLKDEAATDVLSPSHVEDVNISPLLGENLTDGTLARWLYDRVREVERALGTLPSIAIFVDGDDRIDPLLKELRPLLTEHSLDVVGCKEGRIVGTEGQIRIFDVQHIKGLEFEAVFFVGVDKLALRAPDLFDKFLFVGVTRAATYLGVTCEGALPTELQPVRSHFSTNSW